MIILSDDGFVCWTVAASKIDDLTNFVEKVIKNQKRAFGLFNVGSGKIISINNLVKKIINISNSKLTIYHDLSKKSLKNNITFDCRKALKVIKWKPRVTLESGIKKTLKWYKENYKK